MRKTVIELLKEARGEIIGGLVVAFVLWVFNEVFPVIQKQIW